MARTGREQIRTAQRARAVTPVPFCVCVPARNESQRLPVLLDALAAQTIAAYRTATGSKAASSNASSSGLPAPVDIAS